MTIDYIFVSQGCVVESVSRAVQVDPGFSHLTPRLLSSVEAKMRSIAFKLCFQLQPAPLHVGELDDEVAIGGAHGVCKLNPGCPRLLSARASSD